MTFSIVARSDDGQAWGVGVASKYLAAGSAVPALEAGAGALATQALVNVGYRPQGLALLRSGLPAERVVAALVAADDDSEARQLGVVDADGGAAAHTGSACLEWAGSRTGPGYAVQGNILAGPEVVQAMESAWLDARDDEAGVTPQLALARRLVAALDAAEAAGGDRRGRQSAAVMVAGLGEGLGAGRGRGIGADLFVDLRVDDHAAPLEELHRLLDLAELYFGRADPSGLLPLEGELADEVDGRVRALGYTSLDDWAEVENYELRLVDGAIDQVVLAKLREATPDLP